MHFTAGQKLGAYEIIAPIGEGGMGVVYRARDTRLARDVAIKHSAERFTARFEREARVIASLNHANVCTLYDVGPDYLVMELIDGPTLSERLREDGSIPLEESLRIARQIAQALEAAHEKGIVHRDLKPGNVKIRPDGTVKVLDFGLATGDGVAAASADSPTMTGLTEAGIVLGTAAYMSPEQATGKTVDKRADIWAFGVVLFEMLTGERLHRGETSSEVLAAVLKETPDLTRIPPHVRPLLHSCLQKDPRQRLRDIADAKLLVDAAHRAAETPPAGRVRPVWLWPAMAAFLLLLAAVLGVRLWNAPDPPALPPRHLTQILQPEGLTFNVGTQAVISPDERRIAFAAVSPEKGPGMYVLTLGTQELKLLPGSEGIYGISPPPFFSFDSRSVFFAAEGRLWQSDTSGATPAKEFAVVHSPFVQGGTQNEDRVILYAQDTGVLMKVSEANRTPVPVTALAPGETAHRWPQFLPDNRHFLYQRVSALPGKTAIYVGSLDATPETQDMAPRLFTNTEAYWVASRDGKRNFLIYQEGSTLSAKPFDLGTLKPLDDTSSRVTSDVGSYPEATAGLFAVSRSGTIVYRSGGSGLPQELTWRDLDGNKITNLGEKGGYSSFAGSPDGAHVAVAKADAQGDPHIYIQDVSGSKPAQQVTSGGSEGSPVWLDNETIIFASKRGKFFELFKRNYKSSSDTPQSLLPSNNQNKTPTGVSPDGRFLLFTSVDPVTGPDIWLLPLESKDAQPCALMKTPVNETQAQFSHDGHWVVYVRRADRIQVVLRAFSADSPCPSDPSREDANRLVSGDFDGMGPRWDPGRNRIFYAGMNSALMEVQAEFGSDVKIGTPNRRFPGVNPGSSTFALIKDRFLVREPPPGPRYFWLLSNWIEDIKQ